MFERSSKRFPILLLAALAATLTTQVTLGSGDEPGWMSNGRKALVNGTDDWLPGPPNGEIYCSEGTLDLTNPLVPVCPPDASIEFRDVTASSVMHADDPRLSGLLTYTFSGSFSAIDFTGPAWGTWMLETEACEGRWEGTWTGHRSFVAGQSNPLDPFLPPPGFGGVWISALELRGSGEGECIDRLGMKGIEIITTLTPMPVAYEMILPCDVIGCLPEGVSSARVLGPWRP